MGFRLVAPSFDLLLAALPSFKASLIITTHYRGLSPILGAPAGCPVHLADCTLQKAPSVTWKSIPDYLHQPPFLIILCRLYTGLLGVVLIYFACACMHVCVHTCTYGVCAWSHMYWSLWVWLHLYLYAHACRELTWSIFLDHFPVYMLRSLHLI